MHSDVFLARAALPKNIKVQDMLSCHLQQLGSLVADRPLWFPSFNYSFTRTGVYDPQKDISEVGALTEYARTHWATWRKGPPVFHFIGKNTHVADLPEVGEVDPFDQHSLFAQLHQQRGQLLFYGAGFHCCTAIHYVERLFGGLAYRYDKIFSGIVKRGTSELPVALTYHCRPLGQHLDYDWPKLLEDLKA